MKLLIVIVNYRTADLTIDCLASLADEARTLGDARVVVTDNCSGDSSIASIGRAICENGWSDWATLLPLPENGGFAYGNNCGIAWAVEREGWPEFILLLNPDTVVRPAAIKQMVTLLELRPDVGIVGSRLEDPDATPQRSAFRFPTALSELESGLRLGFVSRLLERYVVAPEVPGAAGPTDWVAGASMMVRRRVLEQIGSLDERYFMYFEEVDFCLRAVRAGWLCWYLPDSRVVHLVGQSSGVTDTRKPAKRRPRYWFDSRRRYFVKNHGRLYAMLADVLWMSAYSLWVFRNRLQRKPNGDPPRFLRDFVCNSALLKGIGT